MTISVFASNSLPSNADVLAVGVTSGCKAPKDVDIPVGFDFSYVKRRGFNGNLGETMTMAGDNQTSYTLVGLGETNKLTLDAFRIAAAAVVKSNKKAEHIAISLSGSLPKHIKEADLASAIVEGTALAAYSYTDFKSNSDLAELKSLTIVGEKCNQIEAGIDYAELTTAATVLARDLVNGPPDFVNPSCLVDVARQAAKDNNLEINVWNRSKMRAEGMGGIVGVAEGTDEEPYYIELRYTPARARAKKRIALVGKGITFDSGGLSLKSGDGMMTMKCDMSGAAAVLGVMSVIADLAPAVEVIGICCATENLPGPKAIMPGDVLQARNGKTIEVLNTDAEGRLVLADGLSRAVELEADEIIDIATLTGACIVALGTEIAAIMGNSKSLRENVVAAGAYAGEEFWHLPLPDKYRAHLSSSVADIKNIGNPMQAGSSIGGLFLKEFVGETPWVHLDIAGAAFTASESGYLTRGGTGFGVRTLLEYLRNC